MADILFSNFGKSTLASPVGTGDTTAVLAAGTGSLFPSPTGGDYFIMVITDSATSSNHEVWHVTARSGDSITMTRAEEGTTAQAWVSGDVVICAPTAGTMQAIGQITDIQHGTFNYAADTGAANAYAIALTPAAATGTQAMIVKFKAANTNTGASTLTVNGGTTYNLVAIDGSALNPNAIIANGIVTAEFDSNLGDYVLLSCTGVQYITQNQIPVRQTVLSGPIDANGFPNFGGITGSTTVTATGTLVITAANGSTYGSILDRVGSITNPSWTGLSTNGTMYLYVTVNSDGTCTTGSGTRAPVYQFGGGYSTTNGQFTFDIQAMSGKVGNGATATQSYRVYVGQVTVATGVVSAITWYAIMGRYYGVQTSFTTSAQYSVAANLGFTPWEFHLNLVCQTADINYQPGTIIRVSPNDWDSSTQRGIMLSVVDANTFSVAMGTDTPFIPNANGGIGTGITASRWKFVVLASRGW